MDLTAGLVDPCAKPVVRRPAFCSQQTKTLEKYIMIVYNNRIVYDISSITWEHDDIKWKWCNKLNIRIDSEWYNMRFWIYEDNVI